MSVIKMLIFVCAGIIIYWIILFLWFWSEDKEKWEKLKRKYRW